MQPFRVFRQYEHISFRYEATDYGSSNIEIQYGKQKVVFHPTYMGSNPLWCLLSILPDLVTGYEDHGYTHWSSEPGELRLVISVNNKGLAKLLVKELDELYDYKEQDEARWIIRLEAELPLSIIVNAVIEEAERTIRELGIVGFSESWERDGEAFPISAYLRLKGIKSHVRPDTTRKSSLKKELGILSQLLNH